MRYDQLYPIIDEVKPRTIIEVGVAQGARAKAMVLQALKHRPDVHYIAYDVFETRDAAFHAAAFNLKTVATLAQCKRMMQEIAKGHPGFTFVFVVGDTRETLHGDSVKADFAFIDGDHRVDAISRDYVALKDSAVVVLDDYYTADDRGCPDIDVVGCNRLVEVEALNGSVTLLPMTDQVRDGGLVQMAVVRRA